MDYHVLCRSGRLKKQTLYMRYASGSLNRILITDNAIINLLLPTKVFN